MLLLWSSPVMGMFFYSVPATRCEPAILLRPPGQSPAPSSISSVTLVLRLGTHWQPLLKASLPDLVCCVPSLSKEHCLVTLQFSDVTVCAALTEASKHSADIACRPGASPLSSQAVYIAQMASTHCLLRANHPASCFGMYSLLFLFPFPNQK